MHVERITSNEVENTVNGINNNKSTRSGGILIELVKCELNSLWELLANIFNKLMVKGEELPHDFTSLALDLYIKKIISRIAIITDGLM